MGEEGTEGRRRWRQERVVGKGRVFGFDRPIHRVWQFRLAYCCRTLRRSCGVHAASASAAPAAVDDADAARCLFRCLLLVPSLLWLCCCFVCCTAGVDAADARGFVSLPPVGPNPSLPLLLLLLLLLLLTLPSGGDVQQRNQRRHQQAPLRTPTATAEPDTHATRAAKQGRVHKAGAAAVKPAPEILGLTSPPLLPGGRRKGAGYRASKSCLRGGWWHRLGALRRSEWPCTGSLTGKDGVIGVGAHITHQLRPVGA